MSHPLARDAAPLDAATLATLKREIERPGMNAEKIRRQLVPSVSGATFHRALHGMRVSLPVQRACDAMARELADARNGVRIGLEQGVVQPLHSKAFTLEGAKPDAYDFDPDPEAA